MIRFSVTTLVIQEASLGLLDASCSQGNLRVAKIFSMEELNFTGQKPDANIRYYAAQSKMLLHVCRMIL